MINIWTLTIKEAIELAEMHQDDQFWDIWNLLDISILTQEGI